MFIDLAGRGLLIAYVQTVQGRRGNCSLSIYTVERIRKYNHILHACGTAWRSRLQGNHLRDTARDGKRIQEPAGRTEIHRIRQSACIGTGSCKTEVFLIILLKQTG